jgi:hypothetical protein
MARDATLIQLPNREAIANYVPGLAQAILDFPPLFFHLKIPISKDNTDAQTLFTVPSSVGSYTVRGIYLARAMWEVTADWTGGASSAIGISANRAPFTAKGAVLGGASGDVAAGLTAAGLFTGTVGSQSLVTAVPMHLRAGDLIRFDRITSAFTAGTGFVHLEGSVVVD